MRRSIIVVATDIIDFLTMYPEAWRQVARLLAEIDASDR
jgi:hypothetical protein